jgi:hypothetical protein
MGLIASRLYSYLFGNLVILFLVKRVPDQGLEQRESGETVLYSIFIIILNSYIIIYYMLFLNYLII